MLLPDADSGCTGASLSRRGALIAIGSVPAGLAVAPALSADSPSEGEGWLSLFNGRDLADWHFFQEGVGDTDRDGAVRVHDGMIHILGPDFRGPANPGVGLLTTNARFHDFHLQLEYRWGQRRYEPRRLHKRNSGLLYHLAEPPRRLWPACVEFQIQESDVADAILVDMTGVQGVSLGGTPAWPRQPEWAKAPKIEPSVAEGVSRLWFRKDGNFEREDAWNLLELIVAGDRTAHLVNGRIVNTLFGIRHLDGSLPGAGHLAVEIESAELMIRRIALRPLMEGKLS